MTFLQAISLLWRPTRYFKRGNLNPPIERPDPNRIAVLEHELLGITPEPGTPAAHAVARSRPVDKDSCPHDYIIEVTELGQARRTGLCEACGAWMVATDEGGWART